MKGEHEENGTQTAGRSSFWSANNIFLIIKNHCFNQQTSFSLSPGTTHLIISHHPFNQEEILSGVYFNQVDILLEQLFGWLPVAS